MPNSRWIGALHLFLGRPAVAGDGLLHLRGRIADDRDALLPRRQEDDAARMAHQDGGARMIVMGVKLLDRHRFRLELGDDLHDPVVHGKHLGRHVVGVIVGGANDAGLTDDGVRRPPFR